MPDEMLLVRELRQIVESYEAGAELVVCARYTAESAIAEIERLNRNWDFYIPLRQKMDEALAAEMRSYELIDRVRPFLDRLNTTGFMSKSELVAILADLESPTSLISREET